jgi:hypothetical protein
VSQLTKYWGVQTKADKVLLGAGTKGEKWQAARKTGALLV